MAGEGATAAPLRLIHDVVRISGSGFSGFFKKDCTDMARRVSLLAHLLEEMRDSKRFQVNCEVGSSSLSTCCFADLTLALQDAKRLVLAANDFDDSTLSSDGASKKIFFQFQSVTSKLEKALANLPYDDFDISEEVQEQVELVRSQLKRATQRYGGPTSSILLQKALSQPLDNEIGSQHLENIGNIDYEVNTKVEVVAESFGPVDHSLDEVLTKEDVRNEVNVSKDKESVSGKINSSTCNKNLEENNKKQDSLVIIPDDFRCPISLELMRDPVIVATGQTYERSYIQRWIDCGNTTCPKTQQKLHHLTLTPNYVLRSLISQWCTKHSIDQPTSLKNRKLKNTDGSFRDVTGDIAAIESLVAKLSSTSVDEIRTAVSEIRSLSKRSTDNRILLAEAGAIPKIVNLLTFEDSQIQDNAVTSILNLSIYENNKGLIMLANAIPSIVKVLKNGSTEAKENSAATLFSLSLIDENKIIIGASGAINALVDLLQNGSSRGKKDAATALFNLCIYQGNKGRAVKAGIINVLLELMTDSGNCMVGEALTILSVLASNHEAKKAMVTAGMIPVLIDLLRAGLPRNKENSAAILLALCKRDNGNLGCLSRLGAVIPLSEIARTGTERGKRKAAALLEHLRKFQPV